MDLFHWSLYQIDETDMESLLPFVMRYPQWKHRGEAQPEKRTYADQVNWL